MVKLILTMLLLCSFAVSAGEMNPDCGISHVVPALYEEGLYVIHYYCLTDDGSATVDFEYADLVTINALFNGEIIMPGFDND